MIDTDKYEGHSKGPWYWDGNLCNDEYSDKHGVEQWAVLDWELGVGDADKQLIADTPLILEAYKRLRKQLLRGVKLMNKTPTQTKDGRRYYAKRFEQEVKELIE